MSMALYPRPWAEKDPDRPAVIMDGETISYGELEDRTNRCAQLLWDRGLRPGDHAVVFLENHPRYFEIIWALHRSGLYYTPASSMLTSKELEYVVANCDARAIIASAQLADAARDIGRRAPNLDILLAVNGAIDGFEGYEDVTAGSPPEPLAAEYEGMDMFYSSGTTGRPKGVKRLLDPRPAGQDPWAESVYTRWYGFADGMVYLSTGPLYHAAPLVTCLWTHRVGGTVVALSKFDAELALDLMERHRVTHSQWVPTMFTRLLRLPDDIRHGCDLSSHRFAVHGAAPCPVAVKERMLEWWGPVLHEFYAGTEGNGFTFITPEEWLSHKGSVGQAKWGEIHIVGDDGEELPPGEPGIIYFSSSDRFEYHKDPEKTAASYDHRGWSTLNDVGYLDEEGYLYLTDRKAFMIISGGVNIYPQEVENVLATHPHVLDAAVIGVPNDEFGEEVKAVVQLAPGAPATPATASGLIDWCRSELAAYKCPRSVDFVDELPRLPTGKLVKGELRDRYWAGHATRIV